MADQDELRLRIVPELDQQAKKQVEDDLSSISGNVPMGGKPKGGSDPEASLRKQRLADIRAEIDANDLYLRKFVANSLRKQQIIEQEAALNKTSLKETAQLIAQEENLREEQVQATLQNYDMLQDRLEEFGTYEQDAINRRKQLFFASERAKTGFTSMAGSMTQLTSNTKSANIAFVNFGRIVQDAPFGLLGISNNIDPLLNSFRQLQKETGGTGAALKAMAGQLIGPAGVIFLLGSVLPTALLLAQRAFSETKKEAEKLAETSKTTAEEIGNSFARAAARKGLQQLRDEMAAIGTLIAEDTARSAQLGRNYTDAVSAGAFETVKARNEALNAIIAEQAAIRQSNEDLKNILETYDDEIDKATIRDRILTKVAQTRAGEASATDDESKALEERNKKLLDNFKIMEPLLSLQVTFNDAIKESRDAYLAQALAIRIASEAEAKAFQDKIKREAGKGRENLTDDADYDRAIAQRDALEQLNIDMLRAAGKEEQAITAETERAKREEKMRLLKLGITDTETINNALALVAQEGANRIKDNELTIADARSESMAIYADAVASGLSAIFGENKAIQSAQVVIDTYAGAQKAFASLAPNLPLQIAAAGAVTAQGIATLRKINSTQKGTRSIGRASGGASSPSPQGRSFVTDVGAAGQVAGTIGPFGASMTPSISITANLDRQGLALAVRDGESDIATRQIPFAS